MLSENVIAQFGPEDLKRHLDITFVLDTAGHQPSSKDADRWWYSLRPEKNASTNVYMKDGVQKWKDFGPNGSGGDVLDLIGHLFDCKTFGARIDKAQELLLAQEESGWERPDLREKEPLAPEDVDFLWENKRDVYALGWWLPFWMSRTGLADGDPPYNVYAHPTEDYAIAFFFDMEGNIKRIARRFEDGRKMDWKGSDACYIHCEPRGYGNNRPVILAEGETDTWAAWLALGDEYEVLGVPGAGKTPSLVDDGTLTGREVYLMFDPDGPGIQGMNAWAEHLLLHGSSPRIVIAPEGLDLSKMSPAKIRRLPDGYRVARQAPADLVVNTVFNRYEEARKQTDNKELSNWIFEPHKRIITSEGEVKGLQGIVKPSNKEVLLPYSALTDVRTLKAWGQAHQCRWLGDSNSVQMLAMLLDHQTAYLPDIRTTEVIGLSEGTFVWDDGYIGDEPVVYMPPVTDAHYRVTVIPPSGDFDPVAQFWAMYDAHRPEVTGPMLAWMAAAPLRSLVVEFPTLFIGGLSGAGKSALSRALCAAFTGVHESARVDLKVTTPYGLEAMMTGTNGFPVLFDEYRPGGKQHTLETLQQLSRNAWDGLGGQKGGRTSNLSEVQNVTPIAPHIIAGEDDFDQTSNLERMILLRLSTKGRGNLQALKQFPLGMFPGAYLKHLTTAKGGEEAPVFSTPALPKVELDTERERIKDSLRVLKWGWNLLEDFLTTQDPSFEMPELDLSMVLRSITSDTLAEDQVEALLIDVLENGPSGMNTVLWVDEKEEVLCVSPTNLYQEAVSRKTHDRLPVSTGRALKKWLLDKYPGAEAPDNAVVAPGLRFGGSSRMRVVRIPLDAVPWVQDYTPKENDGAVRQEI